MRPTNFTEELIKAVADVDKCGCDEVAKVYILTKTTHTTVGNHISGGTEPLGVFESISSASAHAEEHNCTPLKWSVHEDDSFSSSKLTTDDENFTRTTYVIKPSPLYWD